MPDRQQSTPHHLQPTFLRGAFLEQWDTVSEDLRPPLLESWAGPWQAFHRNGATVSPWSWEIRRSWETNGHGEPAGVFHSYPLASLVAALLPYRDFPHGYAIIRQPEPEGSPVELNGARVGFVRSGGPGQLKRLEAALRMSAYLAANPEALAAVLEAAGYPVVVEALETVAARVSA